MSCATPILPSGPLGHVPEMPGHVAEIAGHDPEKAGHVRPKYAFNNNYEDQGQRNARAHMHILGQTAMQP